MTSRELFNGIMQALDSHSVQLAALAEQNNVLQRNLEGLGPRNHLPMIRRPVQGVDYGRTCNVAEYVHKKVKEHNDTIAPNAPRYLEFAPSRSYDDLNRSALATIGGIMVRMLGDNYGGERTWEKLYRKRPQACEEILEEARFRPELSVFSQVDGQWCLRELAKNKLKSLVRGSRMHRAAGEGQRIKARDVASGSINDNQTGTELPSQERVVSRNDNEDSERVTHPSTAEPLGESRDNEPPTAQDDQFASIENIPEPGDQFTLSAPTPIPVSGNPSQNI